MLSIIVSHRTTGGKTEYLIRWMGYTAADDTWEPEKHLENCPEVLKEYKRSYGLTKRAAKKA
jgi:hypothetical protein